MTKKEFRNKLISAGLDVEHESDIKILFGLMEEAGTKFDTEKEAILSIGDLSSIRVQLKAALSLTQSSLDRVESLISSNRNSGK